MSVDTYNVMFVTVSPIRNKVYSITDQVVMITYM